MDSGRWRIFAHVSRLPPQEGSINEDEEARKDRPRAGPHSWPLQPHLAGCAKRAVARHAAWWMCDWPRQPHGEAISLCRTWANDDHAAESGALRVRARCNQHRYRSYVRALSNGEA